MPTSATLADGRILAIGGYASTYATAVYAYSPVANTWATLAPMLTARYHAAATRGLDGRVYVFGGRTSVGVATTAEVYNPTTNAWSTVRAPVTGRVGASALTAADGRIYLFGGGSDASGTVTVSTVEIYDPVANTWSAGPALTTTRMFSGSVVGADGRMYLAGGYTGSNYQATATTFSQSPSSSASG